MNAYKTKQFRIKIEQSDFIEYPDEWKDETGPFGGAYAWALENLDENTEVVGIRIKENWYKEKKIYRFKLARGTRNYIRGRMEYHGSRHFLLVNSVLQLVELGNNIASEWIAVEQELDLIAWHQTFNRTIERFKAPIFAPLDPYIAIKELAQEINRANQTDRDWCMEVFDCKLKDIAKKHYRLIFNEENLEEIRSAYNECMDLILDEGVTSENFDDFIDIGVNLVNPMQNCFHIEEEEQE